MQIKGLEVYNGYCCAKPGCSYCTRVLAKVKAHMLPSHGIRAKEHYLTPLWKECLLQTYFTARGRINYFVVVKAEAEESIKAVAHSSSPVFLAAKENPSIQTQSRLATVMVEDLSTPRDGSGRIQQGKARPRLLLLLAQAATV